jgi:formylmethanofuran dehydrogenase subunit B
MAAHCQGEPCSLDQALTTAAALLQTARAPLFFGLARSSTAGAREAIALAEACGGTLDLAASPLQRASLQALQQVGQSTCTLGEVRQRADLLVYWGTDPIAMEPRHWERFVQPAGSGALAAGRAARQIIVIGETTNATAAEADQFLSLAPRHVPEFLNVLRALVQNQTGLPDEVGGLPLAVVAQLAAAMRQCRCGIVFYGAAFASGPDSAATVEALFTLVRELNAHTRFHVRLLREGDELAGADAVLSWQTGFAGSVNFARGYPRSEPLEYAASVVLARGEVDACVLLGSEGLAQLAPAALSALAGMPTIVLQHAGSTSLPFTPTVHMTTGVYGVHCAGTAIRQDEVQLPLAAIFPDRWPSDAELLKQLRARLAPSHL